MRGPYPMRGVLTVAIAACLLLTLAALVPAAEARVPLLVTIERFGGAYVTTIDSMEDLAALTGALYSDSGTRFEIVQGLTWDYRIVAFSSPGGAVGYEVWYRAPRGDVLGTVCCMGSDGVPLPDPRSPDARHVLQSSAFDAVILKYVPPSPPSDESFVVPALTPWSLVGVLAAAIVAFVSVLAAAGRRARSAGTRR